MSEKKRIFYPLPLEELLNMRPTSIKKEKETDFEQRRSNMEKDALKEEKLRLEKERSQKFLESDFDFKGEDEEIVIPEVNFPKEVKFKSSTKIRRAADQSFSMVGYANIPQNLRDYFKIKKIEKPAETDSIEYLKFDKSTHPSIYKYSKNYKIRKVESNIKNLYDISMNSLLTASEIAKRAEILAKLYMKYHYDEEKFKENMEEEDKKNNQKKYDKYMPRHNSRLRGDHQSPLKTLTSQNSSSSPDKAPQNNETKSTSQKLLPPPNLKLPPPSLNSTPITNKPLLPPPKLILPTNKP